MANSRGNGHSNVALWAFVLIVGGVVVYMMLKNKANVNPPPSPSPPAPGPAPTYYYYCTDPTTNTCSVSTQPVACSKDNPAYCYTQTECRQYCTPPEEQFWGCAYANPGDATSARTGACTQYNNATDGPYPSQAACEASQICVVPQSFSCQSSRGTVKCGICIPAPGVTCTYGPTKPSPDPTKRDISAWTACDTQCSAPPPPAPTLYNCTPGGCQESSQGTVSGAVQIRMLRHLTRVLPVSHWSVSVTDTLPGCMRRPTSASTKVFV